MQSWLGGVGCQTDPVLGEWLSDQRAAHRHQRLSKLRSKLLEDLGLFN
jgi:hypothetical protein